ncbi:MAG: peroxiredoxin [Planctomycetes bacterium]|nr:peroxiredoxin [Planctomycetota bacterium]
MDRCSPGFAAATLIAALSTAGELQAQPYAGGQGPWRSVTGLDNNPTYPRWGAANIHLLRYTLLAYEDGTSEPAGTWRPGTRAISNELCAQQGPMPNAGGATNYLWQWGQFLDHDIALTDVAIPHEPFDIPVPRCDPMFDPGCFGNRFIPLSRSIHDPDTGTDPGNPRQQINQITAFIDASNVYGSDHVRAAALRTNDGTGMLRMSFGGLLPWNFDGLPNLGGPSADLFLAGDVRCNEQVGLTSMHTLFVREHNRVARRLRHAIPKMTGEEIYQRARAWVGALLQVITYREFLPLLIGADAIDPYAGYDPDVDPGLVNVFSAACYRVGHTLLSPTIMRLDATGKPIPEGHLALQDAFFAPQRITGEGGIEPILRGLAAAQAQTVDTRIVDDVRNMLFLAPDPTFLDLAAINMQRGRDHGLPGYNQVRVDYDLEPARDFGDITSDKWARRALERMYDHVDDVDAWLGAIAEDHVDGAMVGELIQTVLAEQFARLRDGDRFWHENVFDGADLAELQATRLSDVIRRNTPIRREIQDEVFLMPDRGR